MNLSRTHTAVGLTLLAVFVFAGYNRWTVSSQTSGGTCGNGICEGTEMVCPSCVPGGDCRCKTTCPKDCPSAGGNLCGNKKCDPGEATQCPACTKNNPPCMAPCVTGTCPKDCPAGGGSGKPSCVDTDGGRNVKKKGTMTAVNAKGERLSRSDTCVPSGENKGKLIEYTCKETTPGKPEIITCPSGTKCVDGACKGGTTTGGGTGGGTQKCSFNPCRCFVQRPGQPACTAPVQTVSCTDSKCNTGACTIKPSACPKPGGNTAGTGGQCPPCVPPSDPSCKGTGPCGCGPYVCPKTPPSASRPPAGSLVERRCNDPDKGLDYTRATVVTMKNGTLTQMRDFCMMGVMVGTVAEFYCDPKTDEPARFLHDCNDKVCANGRCTREESLCGPNGCGMEGDDGGIGMMAPQTPGKQADPDGPCAPITCDDGITTYERCTPEGYEIKYFADPCRYN